MAEALEKLDLRTRNRYLRKGLLTQKELDHYLDALPDTTDNSEHIDYDHLFEEQDRMEREQAEAPPPPPPPAPVAAAPKPMETKLPSRFETTPYAIPQATAPVSDGFGAS